MKERTMGEETFELFQVPADDREVDYLVRRNELIHTFCKANSKSTSRVVTSQLITSFDGRTPRSLPCPVVSDLFELGMVFGYLLKESELRKQ